MNGGGLHTLHGCESGGCIGCEGSLAAFLDVMVVSLILSKYTNALEYDSCDAVHRRHALRC